MVPSGEATEKGEKGNPSKDRLERARVLFSKGGFNWNAHRQRTGYRWRGSLISALSLGDCALFCAVRAQLGGAGLSLRAGRCQSSHGSGSCAQ